MFLRRPIKTIEKISKKRYNIENEDKNKVELLMLSDIEIEEKMNEFANRLGYEYCDISWLKWSMNAKKIENKDDGKHRKNYENDALATLGDSILKFVLTEYFFDKVQDKKYITDEKKKIEDNKTLFELSNQLKIYEFAYNDKYFYGESPKEDKVSNKKHNSYIEAIIGAIYKDKRIEYTKEWVIDFLKKNKVLEP